MRLYYSSCYNKHMKFGCKTVAFGVICFLALFFCNQGEVLADTMGVNLELAESVAINVQSDVSLDLQPSNNGAFGQTSFTVYSATNSPAGYTITFSTNSIDLVSETSGQTISALTNIAGGRTAAEFAENSGDMNRWGISIGDTTSYNPVTINDNLVKETFGTTGATPDETTINVGSKVNYEIQKGTYSTTFNFVIVANPITPDFARAYRLAGKTKTAQGYYKMQDMTPAICSAVDEHSEIRVQDIRDNKLYWILKAKDGKCWMTQNLDLDLETTPTNVVALTSENTDINTWNGRTSDNKYTAADGYSESGGVITWTPPVATIAGANSGGTITWTNNQNTIKSLDTGEWFQSNTYFLSNKCPNAAGCNYLSGNSKGYFSVLQSPTAEQMHYHVGNHYNWISAVATNTLSEYQINTFSNNSENPKNSICPSGWRLPIGSSNNSNDDFVTLSSYYPTSDTNKKDLGIASAPLYFLRIGVARDNTIQYTGGSGSYYTSSVYKSGEKYYSVNLDFTTTSLELNRRNQDGWRGRAVRCVAR